MANGWSMKWLHREIVNSSTYQLASSGTNTTDPANVYLWRAERRRLDVEAWRDSLLSVAGNLDETIGGPTFDLKDASILRRTVYAKISRHDLNGLLRLFDFPDANVTADKRTETTVPPAAIVRAQQRVYDESGQGVCRTHRQREPNG